MRVTTVFTPISYEWSDIAQLYSIFYPHVNSLTDVSITPVLHMLTLWDPIFAHIKVRVLLAGLKMAA
jgi:hypothetical protein